MNGATFWPQQAPRMRVSVDEGDPEETEVATNV